MKAHEIVTKLQAIKDSQGFKDMAESDTITVESEGSEYRLPAYEIDNMIKKLSKVNEDKPYNPAKSKAIGSSSRSKALQSLYAEHQGQTIEQRRESLKRAEKWLKTKLKDSGPRWHTEDIEREKNRVYILNLLSPTTNTKKQVKMETKANNGLRLVKYSEKAYAVFGETKPVRKELKEIGGKFNPFLKENGEKSPGWIFSAKKLPELESLVN